MRLLQSLPQHVKRFLLIAYGFSFTLGFGAWYLADSFGVDILLNNDIYFWEGNPNVLLVSLLLTITTLGPFVASLFVWRQSEITLTTRGFNYALMIFLLLAASHVILNSAVWLFDSSSFTPSNLSFPAVIFALIYFGLTSGTEEFGWRGVLYPHIKAHTKSLWDSAFITGLIWGPWHAPFVLYLFVKAGMPVFSIILNFAGFIFSIVLMSYLHGWINLRGGSTLSNYLLHTLHNWYPVALILIFGNTAWATFTGIGAYLITMFVLEYFFSSEVYFPESDADPEAQTG